MKLRHVFLPRAVLRQLATLPAPVRVEVETHLENLASFTFQASGEQVEASFAKGRFEGRFESETAGVRIHFSVDGAMRVLFVHLLEHEGSRDASGR